MRVLFVRHAPALSRASWLRDDMERPLSDKGIIGAKKLFKEFAKIYDAPSVVYSSEALRAKETAQLFSKSFKGARIVESSLLNPGATFESFKNLLADEKSECVAVVGHEPDFSDILSHILASGATVSIDVKKSSMIEVEINEEFRGTLKAMLPPKIFA
jgi:phosphohistidine phosphatase